MTFIYSNLIYPLFLVSICFTLYAPLTLFTLSALRLRLTECSHNDSNLLQMIKINISAKISLSSFLPLRYQLVNNHKLYHYGEEIQDNFSDF